VKPDIGRIWPMGFTNKGSFYYGLRAGANDIYMATMDFTTGKVIAPPEVVSARYDALNSAAAWSPDGEHLLYVSYRGPITQGPGSGVIVVRSMKTGEEREIVPGITGFYQRLRWSPDGNAFLAQGQGPQGGALFRIDARTGGVTQISQAVTMAIQQWNWSPDGKRVFHLASDAKTQRLVSREVETGQEMDVCRVGAPSRNNGLAVSPDGRWLAFTVSDAATRSTALMVVAASGGEPRELLRVKEPESLRASLAWTPDGRQVLFVKGEDPNVQKVPALWHIPVQGGEARKLELALLNLRNMAVHPDGRRIVFAGGENKWEVWVLENFLPGSPARRK
jgi:Tol biopolymer transport system component